jgi:hypothetical protein
MNRPELITAGDEVVKLERFLLDGHSSFSAADVIGFLLL